MASVTTTTGTTTPRPPVITATRTTDTRNGAGSNAKVVEPPPGFGIRKYEGMGAPRPAAPRPQAAAAAPVTDLAALAGNTHAYDDAFQASLATARSAVEAQLRNAYSEVARQEGMAQKNINTLQPTYDGIFGQASGQLQQLGADAAAAQQNAGVASYTPEGSDTRPFEGAMEMARASTSAGVPLMRLGAQDNAARQRGGLAQAGMEAKERLSGEERDYLLQKATEEQGGALKLIELQRQDAQRREDQEREDRIRQEDRDHDFKMSGAKDAAKGPRFGRQEVTAARGAALKNGGKLRKDSAYAKLVAELQKSPPVDEGDLMAKADAFRKKHPKANSQAMSMALFDLYGAE